MSDEQKKDSLKVSVTEGSFAAVSQSVFDQFMTPFAVAISATASQIGFLRAVPQLCSAVVQLFAPEIAEVFRRRKALVVAAALLQGLTWLFVLFIGLWFNSVYALIAAAALIALFGGFLSPLWLSWMGDLTDEGDRGRYFAGRNRVNGIASFTAILAFGAILHRFSTAGSVFTGFAVVFGIAASCRVFSSFLLGRMHEPEHAYSSSGFTFRRFLKELPETNLGLFVLFMTLMTFALNIASPFFAVYVLKELHYDYIQYTVFTLVSTVAAFLFVTYWGRRADRMGNRIIFTVTSMVMPLMPLLWLLTTDFYLITLIQAFGNFAWIGLSLSANNFIYDAVPAEKRTRVLSYYSMLNGLAVFAGASLGGMLLSSITSPLVFASVFHVLFVFAALVRLVVVISFFRRVKEVRVVDVDPSRSEEDMFVRLIIAEPLKEIAGNAATQFATGISGAIRVRDRVVGAGSLAAGALDRRLQSIPEPKPLIGKTIRKTIRQLPKAAGRVGKLVRKKKKRNAG